MTPRLMATCSPLVIAVLVSLSGCGARCPAFGEKRDDLPVSASSGPLTINLRATRIGQTINAPALLSFWTSGDDGAFQLTITDANGIAVAHPDPTPAVHSDPFVLIRLADERGAPLPAGLYGITLTDGPDRTQVTARFEIVRCVRGD